MRYNPLKPDSKLEPHRKVARIPSPPVADRTFRSGSVRLVENNVRDGLELHFPGMPDADVLARLRATKELPAAECWHWHGRGKYWYARRNDKTRAFAEALLSPNAPPEGAELAAHLLSSRSAVLPNQPRGPVPQVAPMAGMTPMGFRPQPDEDSIPDPDTNLVEDEPINVIPVDFPAAPPQSIVPVIPIGPAPAWRNRFRRI